MQYFTTESTCNVNQISFRRSLMFDDVFLFVLDLFFGGFFLVFRRNFKAYVHHARRAFLFKWWIQLHFVYQPKMSNFLFD